MSHRGQGDIQLGLSTPDVTVPRGLPVRLMARDETEVLPRDDILPNAAENTRWVRKAEDSVDHLICTGACETMHQVLGTAKVQERWGLILRSKASTAAKADIGDIPLRSSFTSFVTWSCHS